MVDSKTCPVPRVSVVTLTALVIANMVGTGVFTSLGFQLMSLNSGFVLLLLWFVGGCCAFCGALCYAELGAALARSGGEYHFLTRIYGRSIGFLAGWVSATTGFAAPVALAAMALGSYVNRVFPGLNATGVGLSVIALVTLLHLLRPAVGTAFQNGFTLLKVVLILVVIALAVLHGAPSPMSFAPRPGDMALVAGPGFAISLVFVMYAYSGWNASTYVASEAVNPARDIPRSLLVGTAAVMALYLGLNWAFLRTTPAAELTGRTEVGLIAIGHMVGPRLARFLGGAIALLLVSTISSMVRVGPRVTKTMGEDYPILGFLARTNADGAPWAAILFQSGLSVVLVLSGSFERVLVYAQFLLLLCTLLAAFGVILLRLREPALPRPYHTWGYPVTPVVFLATTLWMMAWVVKDKPRESLLGLTTATVGMVLFTLSHKKTGPAAGAPVSEVE
ncbi:MAG TPA: APC family permease [Holophaga sp.]|nr:APC family permease [Holophaga sp.]